MGRMWKPGEVVAEHRARAVGVFVLMLVSIIAYSGWLFHKATEKAKAPDTTSVVTDVVYTYPDLWICLYADYGCDDFFLQQQCLDSAWMTEGGEPYAAFYPRIKANKTFAHTTEELRIEATQASFDSEGDGQDGRGHCVAFKMSSATAFVGTLRDPHEYLDYVDLDMYWYPGGFGNATTCVEDGEEQSPHRDFLHGFLVDSGGTSISPGIPLSYSCITNTSDDHVVNLLGIGLSTRERYRSSDVDTYTARSRLLGGWVGKANASIAMPYARLSMEIKQEPLSWEIVTEADPYEYAELLGNIGGFWDILLILWPLFFVAAIEKDPPLKPRTFKKSIVRGIERTAGITKAIARPGQTGDNGRGVDGFREEGPSWGTAKGVDGFRQEGPPWEVPASERQEHV
eukprot:g11557.t1